MAPVDPPPPGWAVREEDGKIEYVLCLFAPSAAEAEKMAREEADRYVVDFAERIAMWRRPGAAACWSNSVARHDWERRLRRYLPDLDDDGELVEADGAGNFETWVAAQIQRMARGERPLP